MADYSDFQNHYTGQYLKEAPASSTNRTVLITAALIVSALLVLILTFPSLRGTAVSSAGKAQPTGTVGRKAGTQKHHGRQPDGTKTKALPTTAGTGRRKQGTHKNPGRKPDGTKMKPKSATGKTAIATPAGPTCHFPPRQVPRGPRGTCPSVWFFSPGHKGRKKGQCLAWQQHHFCLTRRGNGFATLKQCQVACEKGGQRRQRSCVHTPKFAPCSRRDRRLQYAVPLPVRSNVSAQPLLNHSSHGQCSLLPANKCTSPKFGFTSKASCEAKCRDAAQDPSCSGGALLHNCRRRERRLPYYFDSKAGQCRLWDNMCLVHGFPSKERCERHCLSSAKTASASRPPKPPHVV